MLTLRRNLGDVNVRADDRGVVAAKLERHALDVVGRCRHDGLARVDRASEGDLADGRRVDEVHADVVALLVVARDEVEDALGEDISEELRDALVDTKRVAEWRAAGLRGPGGRGVFDLPWGFLVVESGGELPASPSF